MKKSFFEYTWHYSRKDQLKLVALTAASFPLLYASLELPKLIINDAISGDDFPIDFIGIEFSQVSYLVILCAAFLIAVIAGGLLKMSLNTYKGNVSERLLRRFRFELIARIIRFPLPHFRRTSQGELISMVTAESEPLGAMMGELVAQPLFLAGQMLTILIFLFLQSFWFGLASIALIPLQAYVIPILQRQINLLQKERITKVRSLSQEIGETVAGVEDLRANNAVRYKLAKFTARLHEIFIIRLNIFRRKFFMKFLNTFINQLTPFFFFLIGGYLVIQGELTLGALVAALAAFKDLSAPWRELLIYYNQIQDYSLRYRTIVDQFDPPGMLDSRLITDTADTIVDLKGPVILSNLTLGDPNHTPLISDMSLEIPAGAIVAIQCTNALARRALVQALSRNLLPQSGQIKIGETSLLTLHQSSISAHIGVVSEDPYLFDGSIGENITLGLRPKPLGLKHYSQEVLQQIAEANRAGNSIDPIETDWLDPAVAGVNTKDELRDWWMHVVQSMGTDEMLFRRGFDAHIDPQKYTRLSKAVTALRRKIRIALDEQGLMEAVVPFRKNTFHTGLTVFENLAFAIRRRTDKNLYHHMPDYIVREIQELGISAPLHNIGLDLASVVVEAFGEVGTKHPLFARLGFNAHTFEDLKSAYHRGRALGTEDAIDDMLLFELLFDANADQFGGKFPINIRDQILQIRKRYLPELQKISAKIMRPLDETAYAPELTILENALFGKLAPSASRTAIDNVRNCVAEVFEQADHTQQEKNETRKRLRKLLPNATIITLETQIEDPNTYDMFFEIIDGRLVESQKNQKETKSETSISEEVAQRLAPLRKAKLFQILSESQLLLLAFASDWVEFPADTTVFEAGEPADAAYFIVEGSGELRWPITPHEDEPIATVGPGRMIGDLAVLTQDTRQLNFITTSNVRAIRIRGSELLEIVENDAAFAFDMLKTVAGHLVRRSSQAAELNSKLNASG